MFKTQQFMTIHTPTFKFEKAPTGNIVSVYKFMDDGWYEVDCFTNYKIKQNFDKMQESCIEWLKEN